MTDKQKEAFENLQRIAMDHVRIAAAIDRAIQEIKREMNNLTPDYARLLVKTEQQYVHDYKKAIGNDLNVREFEAWKDILVALSEDEES